MAEVNSAGDCAQVRNELGVYVLGAIGPAERARVDQHLAACPRCREELAGLAGLPGLLRRVPPDVAMQAWADDTSGARPGPPLDRLISRMSRIRLRRRLTAVAAALVVGLAAATGLQVLHAHLASAAPRWIDTDTGGSPATGAWAAVRYAAQPWGAELEVRVTGIPVGNTLPAPGHQRPRSGHRGRRLDHHRRQPAHLVSRVRAVADGQPARLRHHRGRPDPGHRPRPVSTPGAGPGFPGWTRPGIPRALEQLIPGRGE